MDNMNKIHIGILLLCICFFQHSLSDVTDSTDPTGNETFTTESTTAKPYSCSNDTDCQHGGMCDAGRCNCSGGYIGIHCETRCPGPGTCNINNTIHCTHKILSDGNYEFQCTCLPFYKGDECQIYNYCETNPCKYRGTCELQHPNYICKCRKGDPNNDCNLNDKDDCKSKPPANKNAYITCIDKIGKVGSYKMYCSPGYYGETEGCQHENPMPEEFCNRQGQGYCVDEGFCKPLCNVDACNGTENCEFTANPYNTTGFTNNTDCIRAFGDGYDDRDCHGEETLFDGFDLQINSLSDCSPFFDTICTRDFGNGDCKPECNNEECLFDGYDCLDAFVNDNRTYLAGVVVIELMGSLDVPLNDIQKNISLMLRSGVNLTSVIYQSEPAQLLQLKVADTNFSDIEYAGKFLAAAVAKRPEWLDRVKIVDIYVCPAGRFSSMYADKCWMSCDGCIQEGDICKWTNGECLFDCQPAHSGPDCTPCDSCIQQGDVCRMFTGDCLFGCKTGFYGDKCFPCLNCKREGDICNNSTGVCLHGCAEEDYYGPNCNMCPQNCKGGCNESGICNECVAGYYGSICTKECVAKCMNGTCDFSTGVCESDCRAGYYGNKCNLQCQSTCLRGTCFKNGTCDTGCDLGYFGPLCARKCPAGCKECSREDGHCHGNCRPGFKGSSCEAAVSGNSNMDDVTDNTGVIIGVIISFLLVVLILVVAFCYWKRRNSGDYVMEDEEVDDQMLKNSKVTEVHTNTHMQPTAPLLGQPSEMIELDERHHIAVYAGPGRSAADDNTNDNLPNVQVNEVEPADDKLVGSADRKADDKTSAKSDSGDEQPTNTPNETNDNPDDAKDAGDDNKPEAAADDIEEPGVKKKERCMSSVTMEIGIGGRVLSVSDGDEPQSPTMNKEVEATIGEETEHNDADLDDSAFAEPPSSPLGEVRAPLASEENILASLGPSKIEYSKDDEPADLAPDNKSQSSRSRSGSSTSSSSRSSKGSNREPTTEM